MPLGANPTFIMVRDFFGGSNALRDYYRGGPYVPDIPANANISTDPNQLKLTQFSYADKVTVQPLSVSAPDVFNQVNNGTAQGSSVAGGNGGAGGYTYTWSNSSGATMTTNGATATFRSTRSVAGPATVTVRDAAGATATRTIQVELAVGRPI